MLDEGWDSDEDGFKIFYNGNVIFEHVHGTAFLDTQVLGNFTVDNS